jgi:hypothetical protein
MILLVLVKTPRIMNQVPVAIHATLFITGSCIQYGSVGKHGPAFVWNIKDVSVAFLALLILKGGVGLFAIFFVIIFILDKMNDNVPDTVGGLFIKEINGIIWGRQVAVHAVCHKTLGIVYMCRGFPGIVCELDFVTPCAELGRGGAHHCVIRDAEKGKCNRNAKRDKDDRPNNLPQTQIIWERFRCFHLPS